MKVDLKSMEKELITHLTTAGEFSRADAGKAIRLIQAFTSENLPCTECGAILPLESFFKQSSAKNRNGRTTVCKACYPVKYPQR